MESEPDDRAARRASSVLDTDAAGDRHPRPLAPSINSFPRFDGFAAWNALPPEHQALIGRIALELVATWKVETRDYEDSLPQPVTRANDAANVFLTRFLASVVEESLAEDAFEAEDGAPRIALLIGAICRMCGCTGEDACEEGCDWAEPDLCTACVEKGGG